MKLSRINLISTSVWQSNNCKVHTISFTSFLSQSWISPLCYHFGYPPKVIWPSLLTFYCEIMTDSQKVARKCIRRSCAAFIHPPPILISYLTVVQWQSRKLTLVQTIEVVYISPVICACMCMCVCIVLCNFITYVAFYNHHHN